MGFRNGAWMSVFAVLPKSGGVTQIQGSTSRKDKNTGQYETDFSGYISCVGNDVAQKALQLKPTEGHPVRIHLGDTEVKHVFEMVDGKRRVKYINYNLYSFDQGESSASGNGGMQRNSAPENPMYEGGSGDVEDEGLPF